MLLGRTQGTSAVYQSPLERKPIAPVDKFATCAVDLNQERNQKLRFIHGLTSYCLLVRSDGGSTIKLLIE